MLLVTLNCKEELEDRLFQQVFLTVGENTIICFRLSRTFPNGWIENFHFALRRCDWSEHLRE